LAGIASGVIRWLNKRSEGTAGKPDNIILMAIGTPLVIGIIALSICIAFTRFDIVPETLDRLITCRVINAVFTILATWIIPVFLCYVILARFREEKIGIPFRQVDVWKRSPGAGSS
jgi:hypothetical protein